MKVAIVIPAKGNSTRVYNKNFYKINGKSITKLACEKCLKCKNVNGVYLDTDSDNLIQEVSDLKNLKIIKRPPELANNDINANDLMIFALHSIEECDLILQTFATSPLLKFTTIDYCIDKFLESKDQYDSFFTVCPKQDYLWDKNSNPLNFDLEILPNSFKLEEIYLETHGLYGIFTQDLIRLKRRVGNSPMMIKVSKLESLDIDDYEDIEILERLYDD